MLNWDDESTPALQTVPTSRAAPTSASAAYAQPATAATSTAAPSSRNTPTRTQETAADHRINAADKRIINGQTDVNQLVPFKYKWAWENTSPPAPTIGCRRK